MIFLLNILNEYSALITSLGTVILAGLTYWNIRTDRISRKISEEKEIAIKYLNNLLLLIEYVNIYKQKIEYLSKLYVLLNKDAENSENDDTKDANYSYQYLNHAVNQTFTNIQVYSNKTQDITVELNIHSSLMPKAAEVILRAMENDMVQFDNNVKNKQYEGLLTRKEVSLYKLEIELNLKKVLENKKFFIKDFQWQKLKS